MSIHVSLDAMDFSQSFASRRQRPSHAKVRSAIAAELLFFITYVTLVLVFPSLKPPKRS